MHPKEYKKENNSTGHMTTLQLINSEIIVGVDFTHNKRVNEILALANGSSFLLCPGKVSLNLSISTSSEICSIIENDAYVFLLDGTWSCVRKILKLSKKLQNLKRISFDNKITSKFIIDQHPDSLCHSTIESVNTILI